METLEKHDFTKLFIFSPKIFNKTSKFKVKTKAHIVEFDKNICIDSKSRWLWILSSEFEFGNTGSLAKLDPFFFIGSRSPTFILLEFVRYIA